MLNWFKKIIILTFTTFITTSLGVTGVGCVWSDPDNIDTEVFHKPVLDSHRLRRFIPPDHEPMPLQLMKMQDGMQCKVNALLKNSRLDGEAPANKVFGVNEIHKLKDNRGLFLTGKGVKVVVIGSGVTPNVRLPHLHGGGDYIMPADNGLFDCDHHETIVASIIGAAPSSKDGFIGIAPDARIISIRTTSSAYTPAHPMGDSITKQSLNDLHLLAEAIVHGANFNPQVMNISVTACFEKHTKVEWMDMAAAVWYATKIKNVVIVTSAGNTTDDKCASNPVENLEKPNDPRDWQDVTNISLPSLFSDYLLSVGGTTLQGDPYIHSMAGPWVSVGAPAMNIVALDPSIKASRTGRLTNGEPSTKKKTLGQILPLNGTSYASAYVSGLVALLRQKYPRLNATQIMNLIKNTAHTPSSDLVNVLGYGIIDPIAALTQNIDTNLENHPPVKSVPAPTPIKPPVVDHTARNLATIIMITTSILLLFFCWVYFIFSRRETGEEEPEWVTDMNLRDLENKTTIIKPWGDEDTDE